MLLSPSAEKHNKIPALKYELNTLLSEKKILKPLLVTKQTFFESGDKPHKLARQLRKRESDRAIHKIRSGTGTSVTSHNDINNAFCHYYEVLYSSQAHAPETMKQFLNACQLPTLSESDQNSLGMEITEGDIRKAIDSLKNGKSPGPDGICNEFSKKFGNKISPFLLRMYKKSLEDGKLPSPLNEATITLIPKKGKDLEQVGSFRPVSLLNSDLKILAKTLASRLSPLVTKLIHPDQTGFIPGRHLFHNVRCLLNTLYSPRHPKEDLSAEKAFDCVEFPYLYAVLEKFGLGTGFISWIKLL